MIKDFLLVRAAAHVNPETVWQYLEFKHAPLALSVPALAREFQRYTMNHLVPGVDRTCNLYGTLPGLVTVVEHMFGGWEGIERFSKDAEYLSLVRPDEEHMVRHLMDGAPQFVAIDEERVYFSSAPRARVRMFEFLRRPESLSRPQFLEALHQDGVWTTENLDYRSAVAERIHSITGSGAASFGTDAENFDAVVELRVADSHLWKELLEEQRRRRALFCDPERSFTALTEERRLLN